jgi:diguanylate cyclase (GGDEF)-like protein
MLFRPPLRRILFIAVLAATLSPVAFLLLWPQGEAPWPLVGLIVLLTALVTTFVLARLIARPLAALTHAVEQLPEGDFCSPPGCLPRLVPRELEALARALAAIARHTRAMAAAEEERLRTLNEQLEAARRNLGQANQELAARRFVDDLTRLSNRRALFRRLSELERAHPDTYLPTQILLFRLAAWPTLLAEEGPFVADPALAHAATVLKQETRAGDFLARYGDAHFLLLFPRCSPEAAKSRAETILAALERQPLAHGERIIPLAFEVGLAQSEKPLTAAEFTRLLSDAQRGLDALTATRPART